MYIYIYHIVLGDFSETAQYDTSHYSRTTVRQTTIFDWKLGDNWVLVSMESLEHELKEENYKDTIDVNQKQDDDNNGKPAKYVYKLQIVWFNAIGFFILHLAALYGLYLFLTSSMVLTMVWSKYLCIYYNYNKYIQPEYEK